MSRRNQAIRGKRIYNHTTGTKSFARVRKEKAKDLGYNLTRAGMFKICFTKKDGTQSSPVKDAIVNMDDKEKENLNESNEEISRNDSFAQVIGRDKNGWVNMYGCGVCPSDVYDDMPCRTTNQKKVINTLQNELNELRSELRQLKSKSLHEQSHHPAPTHDTNLGNNDLGPILNVANRHDWSFSSADFSGTPQIGAEVYLKIIIRPTETIAIGLLYSTDPSKEIDGQELGANFWEVYVQVPVKPNENLVRSHGNYKTIGQAVGTNIAWPKPFVLSKDMDFQLPTQLQFSSVQNAFNS